jgi:hypothetical protein
VIVELRRRDPATADVETLATFRLSRDGARVVMERADRAQLAGVEAILGDGVPDERGRLLTADDGEAYLLALLGAYRGSRLWAEQVD